MRSAHSHMDASGILYVIKGNALAVAVVLQDGGPALINTVTTGASTIFPQDAYSESTYIQDAESDSASISQPPLYIL